MSSFLSKFLVKIQNRLTELGTLNIFKHLQLCKTPSNVFEAISNG